VPTEWKNNFVACKETQCYSAHKV